MTFILKTRAVTGKLVPAHGEHREYGDVASAVQDAKTLADVYGEPVAIVDFVSDVTFATVS